MFEMFTGFMVYYCLVLCYVWIFSPLSSFHDFTPQFGNFNEVTVVLLLQLLSFIKCSFFYPRNFR